MSPHGYVEILPIGQTPDTCISMICFLILPIIRLVIISNNFVNDKVLNLHGKDINTTDKILNLSNGGFIRE